MARHRKQKKDGSNKRRKSLRNVQKNFAIEAQKGRPGLNNLRFRIDGLDDQILQLLHQRAEAVLEIGRVKESQQLRFYAPEREKEILERLEKQNKAFKEKFPTAALQRIFREILSASLSLERPLQVAFLGPKATFTHLACIEQFGLSAEMIPFRNIRDIFDEVEHHRVNFGVVPIENSTEGMVTHTLDLFVDSPLKIISEKAIEIEHHLLMKRKRPFSQIDSVVSHSHALAQCRHWLEKHLPQISIKEVESTALAAQMAVDNERVAAIAGAFAASFYQLEIVRERIQDKVDNFTRFLVLGFESPPATGNDKTSILFSVRNEPGALYKMLKPFYENQVNMTKIESRPLKTQLWEYVFFVDIDGHRTEAHVAKAIQDLEKRCYFLKILGSYPKAAGKKSSEKPVVSGSRRKS